MRYILNNNLYLICIMKRPYFRRYKKKVPKRRSMVKKAIRSANTKVFNKKVYKALSRVAETKRASYNINNFALTSVNSSSLDQVIKYLNPSSATGALYNISQGTGQGARIGNRINTKKCILSGVIHINTEYSSQNYNMCPLYVGMYIFKLKKGKEDVAPVEYVVQNQFFQFGSSSTGFSGSLRDLTMEPNSEVVTLLKKRVFKVGTSVVRSATASGTANVLNQDYADGTVGIAKMFKIDVTKCLSSTYMYNDTDNTPTNSNTYVMWIPFRVDGGLILTSGGLATGTLPCYVDFSVDYRYTDI